MRITKTGVVMILAAAVIWFGASAFISKADGVSLQPGSVDDPVITKSYLDEQLAKLTGQDFGNQISTSATKTEDELKQLVAAEMEKWMKENANTASGMSNSAPAAAGTASAVAVVQLQAGETLYAGAGAEVIVRTGKTVAVSSDENGIPDVTAGSDIAAGSAIELNHLLVFPKEGRGIKSDPKNQGDVYVMVRGSYMIMKP